MVSSTTFGSLNHKCSSCKSCSTINTILTIATTLSRKGPGACPPYFSTKMRPEGPKKIFLKTAPSPNLGVWMSAPPLSHDLDSPLTLTTDTTAITLTTPTTLTTLTTDTLLTTYYLLYLLQILYQDRKLDYRTV